MNSWLAIVGVPSTIFASILGWLGYKASRKKDEVAARVGLASENREGINQKLAILDSVIDTLQEERADLRERYSAISIRLDETLKDIKTLHEQHTKCMEQLDAVTKERDLLKMEVERLQKLYEIP